MPTNIKRYFRGTSRPEVFPIRESDSEHSEKAIQQTENIAGTINCKNNSPNYQFDSGTTLIQVAQIGDNNSMGQRVYDPEGIATSITAEGGGQGAKTGLYCVAQRGRGENNDQQLEARQDECTNSLTGVQNEGLIEGDLGVRIRRLTPL